MKKTRFIPIDKHVIFSSPESRNILYGIVNEALDIKSYEYRIYLTPEREMSILLLPGICKPANTAAVKVQIEDADQYISAVEIITSDKYDKAFFEIEDSDGLHQASINLKPIVKDLVSVSVVGRNELEEMVLHICNEIANDPIFDHSLLPYIQPESWSQNTSASIADKDVHYLSIHETIELFKSHITSEENTVFIGCLNRLLEHFSNTMKSKQTDAIRRVFFQSTSAPYMGYFVPTPFYKYVNIKLYLLLYITFKQYLIHTVMQDEDVGYMKRKNSDTWLTRLDRIEAGGTVDSTRLKTVLQKYDIQQLRLAMENKRGDLTSKISETMGVLFEPSDGAKRTFLRIMGFGRS